MRHLQSRKEREVSKILGGEHRQGTRRKHQEQPLKERGHSILDLHDNGYGSSSLTAPIMSFTHLLQVGHCSSEFEVAVLQRAEDARGNALEGTILGQAGRLGQRRGEKEGRDGHEIGGGLHGHPV